MLRNVIDNRIAVIGAVLTLALILFGSVAGIRSTASADGDAWPPFTMTYEMDGAIIGVGDETYQGREVHRLEYRTGTDWIDTVIEAPSVDTVAGPVSAVGSYRRLDRQLLTEFDSFSGRTSVTEIDIGENYIPGAPFSKIPIRVMVEHGHELTKKTTTSKVCFNSSCEINATGIVFDDDGWEYIWVDDARGIPLQVGSSAFVVTDLRIEGEKQEANITP